MKTPEKVIAARHLFIRSLSLSLSLFSSLFFFPISLDVVRRRRPVRTPQTQTRPCEALGRHSSAVTLQPPASSRQCE